MPDPTGPEAAERAAREKVIEAVSEVVGASQDMYCPTQEDVERADAALVTSLTAFRSAVRRAFAAEVRNIIVWSKLKNEHGVEMAVPYNLALNDLDASVARLGEGA